MIHRARTRCAVPDKYLFTDESGNFDFRDSTRFRGASKYFAVGTLTIDGESRMRDLRDELADLRYSLVHNGHEYHNSFHATEDPVPVRNAVFAVLNNHEFKVDVTVLEKSKAQPQTRTSDAVFYKYAWFFHLKYFANRYFTPNDHLMVVSAALGTKKTRKTFRRAVEDVVSQCCHWDVSREFAFWNADTDPCLQAVDYALWAVMRDFEQGDDSWRKSLEGKISSIYDLWSRGKHHYY